MPTILNVFGSPGITSELPVIRVQFHDPWVERFLRSYFDPAECS
jgi:hypothetical protein